jgi:hypothetical protein
METVTLSLWYKGSNFNSGSYRVLASNTSNKIIHLCIHPISKLLGFFQGSTFTPFHETLALIEDNKVYHIILLMNRESWSLVLNGEIIVEDLDVFDIHTNSIERFGGYYPEIMSFKAGLAPSTSLAPRGHDTLHPDGALAPSNTILSLTTHANGWIDEIQIFERLITPSEIDAIIYHTLKKGSTN